MSFKPFYQTKTCFFYMAEPTISPNCKVDIYAIWLTLLCETMTFFRFSPKCSANPITVTPIWKWEFENKECPIRGLYMTFFEKFLFKFPFSHKRFQMGRKCILINCKICNRSPQQIPFQFANGKLPHSHCRGFWAISSCILSAVS